MKHYKSYMDRVTVDDKLHNRLLDLEEPQKTSRRPAWAKYGALAACAALLIGVGVYAAGNGAWSRLTGEAHFAPEPLPSADWGGGPLIDQDPIMSAETIDLAPVDGDDILPGMKTIPGFEVRRNVAGLDVVEYHVLPYIEYGNAAAAGQVAADWGLPSGATHRDLTADEIVSLLGGEDGVSTHLDWSGYELSGWGAWYEDGSFWGAYLRGYAGPLDHFEFAVTAGQLPPTCIAFPDSVEQEIWGVTVTADKYDGQNGCDRRVSFMKDNYGYRFDLTSTDGAEAAEKLVSRAVTYVAVGDGLNLSAVTVDGAVLPDPEPAASQPAVNPDSTTFRPPMAEPSTSALPAPSVSPQDGAASPSRGPAVP